jgi:hypothetical protein
MITCNAVVGLSLLPGGLRPRGQGFHVLGTTVPSRAPIHASRSMSIVARPDDQQCPPGVSRPADEQCTRSVWRPEDEQCTRGADRVEYLSLALPTFTSSSGRPYLHELAIALCRPDTALPGHRYRVVGVDAGAPRHRRLAASARRCARAAPRSASVGFLLALEGAFFLQSLCRFLLLLFLPIHTLAHDPRSR